MGSSQPHVARIETGDENATVDTIERMVKTLGGRFYVSVPPAELHFPAWPTWWEMKDGGVVATTPFTCKGAISNDDGDTLRVIAAWIAGQPQIAVATTTPIALIKEKDTNG